MRLLAAFSVAAICAACGGDADVVINASMLNEVPRSERVVLNVREGAPYYVLSESHGEIDAARIDVRFEGSVSSLAELASSRDIHLTHWDGVRIGSRTKGVLDIEAPVFGSSASAVDDH